MARVVVLLRGVNVGGQNRLAMADLRALLERLGGRDVATYLQSGNAVLSWPGQPEALATQVEKELGLPALVRTGTELAAVVEGNPFAGEEVDPKLLHAVFLSATPEPGLLDLPALLPDRVVPGDRVLYVRYATGSADSRVGRLLSSRRFPLVATARNWRTVLALRDLAH